ncbi:MAG: response regulator transcription factor [Coriobacteriia bacterium]|nr:response regulator transcription factor [Coriobacteriia bacterium]
MDESLGSILLVDDEQAILDFVSYNLKHQGYKVLTAQNGVDALALFKAHSVDMAILDIMLPGMDGYEICRRIRLTSNIPVMFLSARDTEVDKIVGLEIGADDYLAKPFGVRELLARVKALLRRKNIDTQESQNTESRYQANGVVIDKLAHTANYLGKAIDLTPREFELLAVLVKHAGKVLSREKLLQDAWDWQYLVETKTVDTHIKRLRDKLRLAGGDPNAMVETVRGYGYRFKA